MRRLVSDALRRVGGIDVVAEAADGAAALAACRTERPDVLTLDLSMPNTNGLEVLAQLQASRSPVRVVVVSSFSASLVERALDVLDAGATDLVAKPKIGDSVEAFGDAVIRAVRTAAGVRAVGAASEQPSPRVAVPRGRIRGGDARRVLVIASSTGGPKALGELVPMLGPAIGAGGVIVQHMPPGFTAALARRIDAASELSVREAVTGDVLAPDTMLVAPAGLHLRVEGSSGTMRLEAGSPIGGVMPRADVTIEDLARTYGARVVLVVLTGMGNDGLAGAQAVHASGGIVLAQDEADCVVYGMPRHVIEHDLADATGTIEELPVLIERALGTPLR
jgi:two-component system chemotaxis response regulator CheB